MDKFPDIVHSLIRTLIYGKAGRFRTVLCLSIVVVLTVSYVLILPGNTLSKDTAAGMGGIDVPASEQNEGTADDAVEVQEADTASEQENAEVNNTDITDEPGAGRNADETVTDSSADSNTETTDSEIEHEQDTESQDLIYEGDGYTISVRDPQNILPEGTVLSVSEITDEDNNYDDYCSGALEALQQELDADQDAELNFVRLYDIRLIAGDRIIEPEDSVEVTITYDQEDKSSNANDDLKVINEDNVYVVHFAKDEQTGEEQAQVLDTEATSFQVRGEMLEEATFRADSFSVYAIVQAPEAVPPSGWHKVSSVADIVTYGQNGLYVHHPGGFYFKNTMYNVNATRTGIEKTKPASSTPDAALDRGAVAYFFEPVDASAGQFKVYCIGTDDSRKYVNQSGNSLSLVSESDASVFTISAFPNQADTFRILGSNGYYWNMQGGNNGNGFAAYNSATDPNARIQFEYHEHQDNDPYDLDGKSFGIAYHDNNVTSAALTAQEIVVSNRQRLAAEKMVMKPDVLNGEGILLVAENTDIRFWTFESVDEDKYYITTEVDGEKKYLTVNGNEVTLADEPDAGGHSLIRAVPGSGDNAGKWHFTVNGNSLNFSNNVNQGFNAATGTGATTWMNLVMESVLDDDDFTPYTARKVSVSDEDQVYDGQKVVIYTRIWNEETKKYEFFVVDHNGNLLPCYDTGGGIEWLGSQVNTAEWEFTEYRNDDGSLNYYYELKSAQYGNYIAPQITGNQTMSDSPIGINMDGRRYGSNYTTIIAWDDARYSYTGLKAENGKVVPCALAEADDFYFAVVVPVEEQDQLSTVKTIDNNEHGITMKMIDFNNRVEDEQGRPSQTGRDSGQTAVLGFGTNSYGLVSTDLKDDGYPVTDPDKTGKPAASLGQLFDSPDAVDANHLFIESIYNESGYFEYDSTQNFSRFNENNDGNFTVYDQLGAISNYNGPTGRHGQFLPYNDLIEGEYCDFTNDTNVLAQELPDTYTRKGEKLYNLGTRTTVDYFFGMELEASFTQTANGLDAWGHDIIFEFSGDDDFWLYVDGELVLDVGGTHAASIGNINFRTGEVTTIIRNVNGTVDRQQHTTLREVYENNYRTRYPDKTDAEVAEYLDGIFHLNDDGNYVFKDYTNHTMKMFYMERGAGASNLHMRFNLAAVKPGTVELGKKISGAAENSSNNLIQFPYQIWYNTESDPTFRLFGTRAGEKDLVKYKDTTTSVPYHPNLNIAGTTYEHVFMIRPGERAVIDLPQDTSQYYFKECGVNTDIYDKVLANGEELAGTPVGERKDFAVNPADMNVRPEVIYDNQVKEGTVRTLSISKKLYDTDGETELEYPDIKTLFSFRLYLGTEYADDENLPLAYLYSYFVKDTAGNYCRWNSAGAESGFVPISPAISDYEDLKALLDTMTPAEKEAIIFRTSPNGAISKIPAGYTVEVRDLVVGTKWKVEERDGEIPRGYTRREEDGYTRTDTDPDITQKDPVSGVMEARPEDHPDEPDPAVDVRNQIGWGLTVKKVWTDKDFMSSHDDIYFAVFMNDDPDAEPGIDQLIPGTVRRLKSPSDELYYFFDDLKDEHGQTHQFSEFVIREVVLTGAEISVDPETGEEVITYDTITPIENGGSLVNGGVPAGGEHHDGYQYSVNYEPGESTGHNENIRIDTVTNSRPGIRIYKTMWNWTDPLGNARFTLKDGDGHDAAAASYTSRSSDGLVTIAYLNPGTYTLTETGTPNGYVAMRTPLTITVGEEGEISISDTDEEFCKCHQATEEEMAEIIVRNRPVEFKAVKIDSDTGQAISDVHFALYKQVTDAHGVPRKDYEPIASFEDKVTGADGVIPDIDMLHLNAGIYYLTETQAAGGYEPITSDICFTIGDDGKVTVSSEGHESWISERTDPETGLTSYTLTVYNGKMKKVSFMKVNIADTSETLAGAEFDLYSVSGEGEETERALIMSGLTSGEDGMLSNGTITQFELPIGTYQLEETQAPSGYDKKDSPVIIHIKAGEDTESADFDIEKRLNGVDYDEGTDMSADGSGLKYDAGSKVYTMKITNTSGVELPEAGGIGTTIFYVLGTILILGCGIVLAARKRME